MLFSSKCVDFFGTPGISFHGIEKAVTEMNKERAYSVQVWCTKSPVFQEQWSKLEQTWQFARVTDIITYGLLYFLEELKPGSD